MKIARASAQLFFSRSAQAILALVANVIVARATGPSGLGKYGVLLALVVLLQGLTSLGFEDVVLARGPASGSDTPRARGLYVSAIKIRVVTSCILGLGGAATALGWLPDFVPHTPRLALTFVWLYAGLNSIATLGAAIQSARVRPGASAALDASWAVGVATTYGALAALHSLTVTTALLATAGWQGIVVVGYAWNLAPLIQWSRLSERSPGIRVRESVMFWANGLLSIGVGKNSDLLAMSVAGATPVATGLYNAAYNANVAVVQAPLQGMSTMFYVSLGIAFGAGSTERTVATWRTVTLLGNLFTVPFIVFGVLFPGGILSLLYGGRYSGAEEALVLVLALGAAGRVLGGGGGQAILFLANRQSLVLRVRAVCVTLNMFGDVVGYKLAGIDGVAIASGGSGLAITAIELVLARHIVPVTLPFRPIIRIATPYLGVGIGLRLLAGTSHSRWLDLCYVALIVTLGSALLMVTRPLRGEELPTIGPPWFLRIINRLA